MSKYKFLSQTTCYPNDGGKSIQTISNINFLRTREMNPILLYSINTYLILLRKWASTLEINYSMQYPVITIPPPYILYIFLIIRRNKPRFSTDYPIFSLKIYSSTPTISLLDQVSSDILWVYEIKTSAPLLTQMSYIMRK